MARPLTAAGDGDNGQTPGVCGASRQDRLVGLGAERPQTPDPCETEPTGERAARHLLEPSVPTDEGCTERVEIMEVDACPPELSYQSAHGIASPLHRRAGLDLARIVYRLVLAIGFRYDIGP